MTTPAARPLSSLEARPHWRMSRLARRLAAVGILAVVAGVLTARPEPIVVAAPCLLAVVVALRQPRPETVMVTATVSELRCFEQDAIEIAVRVRAEAELGGIGLELALPTAVGSEGALNEVGEGDRNPRVVASALFDVEEGRRDSAFGVAEYARTWTVRVGRWGRWRLGPLHLRVRTRGWGYVGTAELTLSELTVFPPPARARDIAVPPMLLARVGSHVARRAGAGVEFAGLRAFAPGDAVRRINWPVSSRRGELYVNEFAAERAADIVAVVDTTVDVGLFGRSSLDLGVRGAAAVVQAYLRYADRVGVVALGGALRWLSPDVGLRQYYRIVETLLASRRDNSYVDPDLNRLPRQAPPPGALAFVFTPLLDGRVVEAIRDLRERGHPVVVVDVLPVEPPAGEDREARLALRLWRLDREVLVHGLEAMGVTVLRWDEQDGVPLDRVRLEPLLRGGR
ncbi:DUF58 domain-containing protein [Actinopolymorpha alba]|uniref:DUF58 domain-containing protein n=1 Tax=Actinopolymorpha alba TaxID=533267 RepID=UPI0003793A5D|nr:DUF58 domain-containing protein [Actinopolymorpha alba]